VAAGYTSKMRWNPPDQWIWSEQPAHAPLVSRDTFDAVQQRIASRSRPQQTRKPRATPRPYLLRGRLRCGLCQRCMQGNWVREEAYYRCRYPAQYAIATTLRHPKSVNPREADLLPSLDGWIAELFDLDATCAQLVSFTNNQADSNEVARAHHTIRECDLALRRYRAALEQGANPETVTQWINGATATKQPPRGACGSYPAMTMWRGSRSSRSATWSYGWARSSSSSPTPTPPTGLGSMNSSASTCSTSQRNGSCWPALTFVGISRVSEGPNSTICLRKLIATLLP
jgi:hypothetical protein